MSDSTDDAILDAAEQLFGEQGFHETVVADVAREADVGKGTVYRRFGNKTDLFAELICQGTDQLIEDLRSNVDLENSLEDRLETIVSIHLDMFEESRYLVVILVQEGLSNTGDWQEQVVERWEQYRGLLETFFEDDRAQAVLGEDFSPSNCARLLGNSIWGTLRSIVIFQEPKPREQYETTLKQLFISGVTDDG